MWLFVWSGDWCCVGELWENLFYWCFFRDLVIYVWWIVCGVNFVFFVRGGGGGLVMEG